MPKGTLSWNMRPYRLAFALGLALTLLMAIPGHVAAEEVSPQIPNRFTSELEDGMPKFLKCPGQTYALCAASSCYVYNDVAYCKCDVVEDGDSISLAFEVENGVNGENVCEVNANGVGNGYMVSTFSLPDSVLKDGGEMALYTCPGGGSDGAYAQCDGGLCFESTEGSPSFPGFEQPLLADEIICSCPITIHKEKQIFGYQIPGPFPCEQSIFEQCSSDTTNDRTGTNANTGTTIPVGAPVGSVRILALMLDGPPLPRLNFCQSVTP
jgi:hypothetical protein